MIMRVLKEIDFVLLEIGKSSLKLLGDSYETLKKTSILKSS